LASGSIYNAKFSSKLTKGLKKLECNIKVGSMASKWWTL